MGIEHMESALAIGIGIGRGLKMSQKMFNTAAFLRLPQVRSLWPL